MQEPTTTRPDEALLDGLYQVSGISVIRTHSGRYVDVAQPRPEDICIADIAHALSLTCRWGGHTPKFYSVAEHCLLMLFVAEKRGAGRLQKLAVLLHDASEAYLGDIPKPIKKVLPDFQIMEERMEQAIWKKYNLPQDKDTMELIRDLDRDALEFEWLRFFTYSKARDLRGIMQPEQAETEFRRAFKLLFKPSIVGQY